VQDLLVLVVGLAVLAVVLVAVLVVALVAVLVAVLVVVLVAPVVVLVGAARHVARVVGVAAVKNSNLWTCRPTHPMMLQCLMARW
jgi:hypothetical protein